MVWYFGIREPFTLLIPCPFRLAGSDRRMTPSRIWIGKTTISITYPERERAHWWWDRRITHRIHRLPDVRTVAAILERVSEVE